MQELARALTNNAGSGMDPDDLRAASSGWATWALENHHDNDKGSPVLTAGLAISIAVANYLALLERANRS